MADRVCEIVRSRTETMLASPWHELGYVKLLGVVRYVQFYLHNWVWLVVFTSFHCNWGAPFEHVVRLIKRILQRRRIDVALRTTIDEHCDYFMCLGVAS